MKKEIAIIGYGRFGRCAAHHLKHRLRVLVADARTIQRAEKGVRKVSIEAAARSSLIILAVPINRLAFVLKKIAPLLKPRALICDVCSVKERPVKWMKQLLPSGVAILGTHPLFGPDSASASLQGRTIVLCPVRIRRARLHHIRGILMKMKLKVVTMTPTQHDRLMARTLFLTQFVGRGLLEMHLPQTLNSPQHFHFLLQLVRTAKNDTKELFHDMYRYNRFATTIPRTLIGSFQRTRRSLPATQK